MKESLVVLKYGSSVLSDCSRLQPVVHEIYRHYRRGSKVIAVVSAIGRHTDVLLAEAERVSRPAAPDRALAQLLSTGEQQSAALLTMSLSRAGIPCELLDATTAGLILSGDRLDADPKIIDIDTVRRTLSVTPVVVLPGFIGRHECGGTALMGRGGSDLTAVFLAEQLGADACRLVKDVDGIYDRDPAEPGKAAQDERPHRYGTVTYEEALRVADVLVQPKAIEYLQTNSNTACVSALLHEDGTEVGAAITTTADATVAPPLKVLLLGLGEVGQGVYRHLQQLPEFFVVVGIHVRDVAKHVDNDVPQALLNCDVRQLITRPHDLLVDVSGDRQTANSLLEGCLGSGRPAVTASKSLVADRGADLSVIALRTYTEFRYSAAVGGSAPMIETVRRAAQWGSVTRLRGVLNGTCNYILDRCAGGLSFDEAVVEAQAKGFAEADIERDINGKDSEDKLRILSRIAFGAGLDGLPILRQGLEAVTQEDIRLAKASGQVIRLVASIDTEGMAQIAPESLPQDDYLAGARAEENRLVITSASGCSWQVSGKGAGRWPTAEAVIADMLDVYAATAAATALGLERQVRSSWRETRLPPA